jgi:hypothetical protein
MTLDPNWFYSSLAQSAASIVGLLGAILVTRLQAQLSDVKQTRRRLHRAVANYRELCTRTLQELNVISAGVVSVQPSRVSVELADPDDPGSYQPGGALYQQVAQLRHSLTRSLIAVDREALREHSDNLLSLATFARPDIRELSFRSMRSLHRVVAAAGDLEIKASVTMPTVVLLILSWLCASGVLIPLLFLSAQADESKKYLWIVFSSGIAGILTYVGFQILEVRRAGRVDLRGPAGR